MKGEKIPDCEDITNNFRDSSDHMLFCDTVLKSGYGVTKWKTRCVHSKMSTFIKPAFEAFVVLAYENCNEGYKDEGQGRGPAKKLKYTADKKLCSRNKGCQMRLF